MFDVAIIGGGVIGCATAYKLSRYKLNVCLLEKENDVAMGATKANSAIVHAGFDAKEGSFKARFNVRGSEMMEQVAAELDRQLDRGATFLRGEGSYTREEMMVVLAAVKRHQVADLKRLVMEVDPAAFVIVQDAHQVLGDGFSRYSKDSL